MADQLLPEEITANDFKGITSFSSPDVDLTPSLPNPVNPIASLTDTIKSGFPSATHIIPEAQFHAISTAMSNGIVPFVNATETSIMNRVVPLEAKVSVLQAQVATLITAVAALQVTVGALSTAVTALSSPSSLLSSVGGAISTVVGGVVHGVETVASGIISGVKTVVGGVVNAVTNVFKGIGHFFGF